MTILAGTFGEHAVSASLEVDASRQRVVGILSIEETVSGQRLLPRGDHEEHRPELVIAVSERIKCGKGLLPYSAHGPGNDVGRSTLQGADLSTEFTKREGVRREQSSSSS